MIRDSDKWIVTLNAGFLLKSIALMSQISAISLQWYFSNSHINIAAFYSLYRTDLLWIIQNSKLMYISSHWISIRPESNTAVVQKQYQIRHRLLQITSRLSSQIALCLPMSPWLRKIPSKRIKVEQPWL